MLFLAYPPIDCLTGWMHKGFRCGYKFQVWHLEINIPMSRLLKMDLLKIQRKKKKKNTEGNTLCSAISEDIVFLRYSHLYKTYAYLSSHSVQGLSSTLVFMLTPPTEEFQL